jgi:hypothetical protein
LLNAVAGRPFLRRAVLRSTRHSVNIDAGI